MCGGCRRRCGGTLQDGEDEGSREDAEVANLPDAAEDGSEVLSNDDPSGSEGLSPDDGQDSACPVSGMYEIDGSTYRFDDDGSMVVGWVVFDGDVYYFDPGSGAMVTDCAALIKGLCAPTQAAYGSSYADVSDATPHADDIAWTYETGISAGWASSDGTRAFRPMDTIKRQDMAAFLYRLAGSPAYEPSAADAAFFSDVTPETSHALEVWWLANTGVSEGWRGAGGTRTFRPMDTVKRQDMAAFLYRLAGSPGYTPTLDEQASFADVTSSTPHADEVSMRRDGARICADHVSCAYFPHMLAIDSPVLL